MAHGIQILNPSGYVQIDENYARFRLLQSGSMATPGPLNIAAQAQAPIVFIRPASYGAPMRVGSVYTNAIWVYSGNYNGAPEMNVSYALVNRSDLIAVPGGVGINVMDASNKLMFTSNDRFICIDTVINYTIGTGVQDFTVPTPIFGSRFIAMVGPNMTRLYTSANYLYNFSMTMTLLSETSIRINEVAFAPMFVGMTLTAQSVVGQPCTLISGYL